MTEKQLDATRAKWQLAQDDMVICYICVRTDVPNFMWGKTAAQTAHTGTQLVVDLYDKNFPDLNEMFDEWRRDPVLELAAAEAYANMKAGDKESVAAYETAQSAAKNAVRTFGTKLTLAVTAGEMRQVVNMAQLLSFHAGITHDPTYPIFIRDGDRTQVTTLPVDTCAYVFGRKSQLAPILGRFDLLNERHIVG